MSAREQVVRDYIVAALREAGAMYEDGAREFLAEHDASVRSEALAEAVGLVSLLVDLGAPPERILTELRRMASTNTTQET